MEWNTARPPRVLLLGNGILRLANGMSWYALLKGIDKAEKPVSDCVLKNEIPSSMWIEALYGCDAEVNRRLAASVIEQQKLCITDTFRELISLPWDCILTTNYSYETEEVLTDGRWSTVRSLRSRSCRCLDGQPRKHDNLCICYEIKTEQGKTIPVWHIHGDYLRHSSMILTYYSYANQINRLITYNKSRGNAFEEAIRDNKPVKMQSWLDWYVLGDVYSVGFGFDTSEFDLWWATERKVREHAPHGTLHFYMEEQLLRGRTAIMLDSIIAKPIGLPTDKGYTGYYQDIINDIRKRFHE